MQGFLYVLDHKGVAKAGWPRQMGDIQGQPACADVTGNGKMEVVAADTKGNIAAFDANGEEVWERHLGSLIAQVPPITPTPPPMLLAAFLAHSMWGFDYALDRLAGKHTFIR